MQKMGLWRNAVRPDLILTLKTAGKAGYDRLFNGYSDARRVSGQHVLLCLALLVVDHTYIILPQESLGFKVAFLIASSVGNGAPLLVY